MVFINVLKKEKKKGNWKGNSVLTLLSNIFFFVQQKNLFFRHVFWLLVFLWRFFLLLKTCWAWGQINLSFFHFWFPIAKDLFVSQRLKKIQTFSFQCHLLKKKKKKKKYSSDSILMKDSNRFLKCLLMKARVFLTFTIISFFFFFFHIYKIVFEVKLKLIEGEQKEEKETLRRQFPIISLRKLKLLNQKHPKTP